MRYQLKVAVLGKTPTLEIDKDRFEEIRAAKGILSSALALEEKYEILLANYISLEKAILVHATDELVYHSYEYRNFFQLRLAFNVQFVNLLSAARLYADLVCRHVRECVPTDPCAFDQTKALLNQAYDSSFQYRFMEALRNHVQHNGVAVHKVSIGGSRNSDEMLEHGLALIAETRFLAEDTEFKAATLAECPKEIDLMLSARAYLEQFGNIQKSARKIVNPSIGAAREVIESARRDYESKWRGDNGALVGLEAQAIESTKLVERHNLLLDWDDVRKELVGRNGTLGNLPKRYVSGRSRAT